MSKIEINEIPMDRSLTGYLWMSNEREPRVLENCSIEQSNKQHGANPALLQTGAIYFTNKDSCKAAIELIGEERLKKYYFEVK